MHICKKLSMKYRTLFFILMTTAIECNEAVAQKNFENPAYSFLKVLNYLQDSLHRPGILSADSLATDSLSLFSSLAEEVISNQVNRVASGEWSLTRQLVNESPDEKLKELSGFNALDPFPAINHFSGKEEMLNRGIQAISDLHSQKEHFFKKWIRSDSALRSPKAISVALSMGIIRPFSSSLTTDLYPSIGFTTGSGITVLCGWTQRIGYGKYYGGRLAFDYSWKYGFSVLAELERLVQDQEGVEVRRNHFLTGIEKSVKISDRAQSYVLTLIDWGRQLPDDGYAERYRIRVGIDYLLWKK